MRSSSSSAMDTLFEAISSVCTQGSLSSMSGRSYDGVADDGVVLSKAKKVLSFYGFRTNLSQMDEIWRKD